MSILSSLTDAIVSFFTPSVVSDSDTLHQDDSSPDGPLAGPNSSHGGGPSRDDAEGVDAQEGPLLRFRDGLSGDIVMRIPFGYLVKTYPSVHDFLKNHVMCVAKAPPSFLLLMLTFPADFPEANFDFVREWADVEKLFADAGGGGAAADPGGSLEQSAEDHNLDHDTEDGGLDLTLLVKPTPDLCVLTCDEYTDLLDEFSKERFPNRPKFEEIPLHVHEAEGLFAPRLPAPRTRTPAFADIPHSWLKDKRYRDAEDYPALKRERWVEILEEFNFFCTTTSIEDYLLDPRPRPRYNDWNFERAIISANTMRALVFVPVNRDQVTDDFLHVVREWITRKKDDHTDSAILKEILTKKDMRGITLFDAVLKWFLASMPLRGTRQSPSNVKFAYEYSKIGVLSPKSAQESRGLHDQYMFNVAQFDRFCCLLEEHGVFDDFLAESTFARNWYSLTVQAKARLPYSCDMQIEVPPEIEHWFEPHLRAERRLRRQAARRATLGLEEFLSDLEAEAAREWAKVGGQAEIVEQRDKNDQQDGGSRLALTLFAPGGLGGGEQSGGLVEHLGGLGGGEQPREEGGEELISDRQDEIVEPSGGLGGGEQPREEGGEEF